MHSTRQQFTNASLLKLVHGIFKQNHQDTPGTFAISTADCLMSALAMFTLKYPSLLQFDQEIHYKALRHNLKTLYDVKMAPCDTTMRERLDGVDLTTIRSACQAILYRLQRGKVLERWRFLEKYYLVSLDGSQFFSSNKVHCNHCCETHHKNGSITYHHQMVVGSIVNPSMRQVLPIGFEPIVKEDGALKNDCERNASKRWLQEFRTQHPQLPTVIVADGLSANDPFIAMLEQHRCHYILVCKEDDHKYLWDWFWHAEAPDMVAFEEIDTNVTKHYRFMHNVPLNDSSDRKVTVVYYQELHTKPAKSKRKKPDYSCGWVTDLAVTVENVKEIVKGGRARWKIENETFNTLKNQNYNFAHNYGHGLKTLSNILAGIMLLAFLIDQTLESVNLDFQKSLKHLVSRCNLWRQISARFSLLHLESWDQLYSSILDPPILVI